MPQTRAELARFFGATAPVYEARIVPAFRPFARAVVQTAIPQGHEIALDLGTGTGVLARELAPYVRYVVGVDAVEAMARAGRPITEAAVGLAVADAHFLPFAEETFHLCAASFGLNSTTPRRVLPEIQRVLRAGGVLAFHEWSLQHRYDTLIAETLSAYMLADEDAPPDLLTLRESLRAPHPWDNTFQTLADFADELSAYGLRPMVLRESAPVSLRLSVDDFLAYKLAWANRQAELAALDPYTRADCLDALRRLFQDEAGLDSLLNYDPVLFVVRAQKI
jgi:SAM-dependent methyltransferase